MRVSTIFTGSPVCRTALDVPWQKHYLHEQEGDEN